MSRIAVVVTAVLDSESTKGGTILTSTKLNDVFHVNWVPVYMKEQKVR